MDRCGNRRAVPHRNGQVGVQTRADSVTLFDELSAAAL